MKVGFPAPILLPIPSNGIISNAPLALTYGVMPQDLVHGHVQSWNFAVRRKLPAGFTFEAAYVGNHGVDDPVAYQLNRGLVLGAGAAGQSLNQLVGRRTSTTTIIGVDTHYHSVQAKLNRRYTNGLSITTTYTWSKAWTTVPIGSAHPRTSSISAVIILVRISTTPRYMCKASYTNFHLEERKSG